MIFKFRSSWFHKFYICSTEIAFCFTRHFANKLSMRAWVDCLRRKRCESLLCFRRSSVDSDCVFLSHAGLQHQNAGHNVVTDSTDCHAAQCPVHQHYGEVCTPRRTCHVMNCFNLMPKIRTWRAAGSGQQIKEEFTPLSSSFSLCERKGWSNSETYF